MVWRLSLIVDCEVRMMFARRRRSYVDVSLGGGCRAAAMGRRLARGNSVIACPIDGEASLRHAT